MAVTLSCSLAVAWCAGDRTHEAGQAIVTVAGEYRSDVYPWRGLAAETGVRLVAAGAPSPIGTPGRTVGWTERVLNGITREAALVAVANVDADTRAVTRVALRRVAPMAMDPDPEMPPVVIVEEDPVDDGGCSHLPTRAPALPPWMLVLFLLRRRRSTS